MTYSEGLELAQKHLPAFKTHNTFKIGGMNCQFLGFIVCPEDADIELKNNIFEQVMYKGVDNEFLLREFGLAGKAQNVFLVYLQGGDKLVVPFNPDAIDFST